jgi:hypothetical protein
MTTAGTRHPPTNDESMTIQHRSQPTATEPTEQAGSTAREKAQQKERENEDAIVEMRELEAGDPPTDLDDWPSGPAKYLTYGNEEDEVYGVGVTAKLGPANLALHRRLDRDRRQEGRQPGGLQG